MGWIRVGWIGVGLAMSILAGSAAAYEIRPRLGLHEAMSLLAAECLTAARGRKPEDCLSYAPHLGQLVGRKLKFAYGDHEKNARWPDDPTRQIRTATLVKFGFNAKINCPSHLRSNPDIGSGGLLCSTHHGKLQFWHAMISEPGETTSQTRAKILGWARFNFEVASGRLRTDTDYCDYWRSNPSSISAVMAPANFPFCVSATRPRGWQLSTLYNLECSNPLSSRTCDEVTGMAATAVARRAATGALLHLIQDSYSQSHAARGPADPDGFSPRVYCAFPSRYYDYTRQSSGAHGAADKIPTFTACTAGGRVHDVLTASAMTLWHVREQTDPDTYIRYLEDHVFGGS